MSHIIDMMSDALKLTFNRHKIPIWYFREQYNVGDRLNELLVPCFSGRNLLPLKTGKFRHLRAIGSILDHANRNSIVWGSGLIEPQIPPKEIDGENIFSLRGGLTYEVLRDICAIRPGIPLADPGVLIPLVIQERPPKRYELGIVPHYADIYKFERANQFIDNGISLIDVRSDPISFCRRLLECNFIVSSSLHGLILSDAFGIRNEWVQFSNHLKGGTFKFEDYYSTVEPQKRRPVEIDDPIDLIRMKNSIISASSVSLYKYNKTQFLASFPDVGRIFGL